MPALNSTKFNLASFKIRPRLNASLNRIKPKLNPIQPFAHFVLFSVLPPHSRNSLIHTSFPLFRFTPSLYISFSCPYCLGEHPRFFFPKTFPLEYRLKDILEDNVDESYYLKPQQVESIIRHCERKVAEGCGFKVNFQSPDDISGAIKTKEGQREYDTYIKEPLNTDMQGNSRTITAHYHKLGYTDFSSDLCPHTGVMEYSPLFLGYTRDHKGKVVSHDLKDISNTIVASNHGRNGSTAQYLVEPMIYSSPHGFNFGGVKI